MQPETEGARWYREGERDLAAARLLKDGGHFNLACFHAQQSAEMAVKAFLYTRGAEEVWGHSVGKLIKDASTYDRQLDRLYRTGVGLDKFYITTRYPNGLPDGLPSDAYDEDDATDAIGKAEKVMAGIGKFLKI